MVYRTALHRHPPCRLSAWDGNSAMTEMMISSLSTDFYNLMSSRCDTVFTLLLVHGISKAVWGG